MSASQHEPVGQIAPWSAPREGGRLTQQRLPWPVAAPLIAALSVGCWLAAWKVIVTIGQLLV